MEKKEIVKKLLVGPLDWITLTPFLTGVTVGLGAWAVANIGRIVVRIETKTVSLHMPFLRKGKSTVSFF